MTSAHAHIDRIRYAPFLFYTLVRTLAGQDLGAGKTELITSTSMVSNATDTEYDFVEKPSQEHFCPVTFEILKDPRQTNSCCGNHLSRAVAERLEKEGKPCPMCKKTPLKTAEDLFFKRKVLALKVNCRNKVPGCKWVGELGELDNHLKIGSIEGRCLFVSVECPLKCDKHIQRCNLEEHKSSKCVKRPFTCKYCEYEATYELVANEHWLQCQKYPEKCPNKCSEDNIERQFLQRHLDDECPLQEVECKFSYAGCPVKMKRREIQKHMDESKDEHLENVGNYGKTMDLKFQALAVAITKIAPQPIFVPPPEFTVDSFAKHKTANDVWDSPSFYSHIGGYKMCLDVYANGIDDGEGTHVSVFVYMMKGEFDSHLQWPFKGEVEVQLVNQREGGEHLEEAIIEITDEAMDDDDYVDNFSRVMMGVKSTSGFGYTTLISHTDLYKPEEGKEFLKNDTLKFRVTEIVVTSV